MSEMRAIGTIRKVGLGLGVLLMAGCTTFDVAEVKKGPRSGFLGRDYALLTPGEVAKGQAGLRYFNPQASWRQYGRVILEPVTFWGDDVGKVAPANQQALGAYFNASLEREFGKRFDIVTVRGPGVVRLQVAVVDVEAATPGLRFAGRRDRARVVLDPGIASAPVPGRDGDGTRTPPAGPAHGLR